MADGLHHVVGLLLRADQFALLLGIAVRVMLVAVALLLTTDQRSALLIAGCVMGVDLGLRKLADQIPVFIVAVLTMRMDDKIRLATDQVALAVIALACMRVDVQRAVQFPGGFGHGNRREDQCVDGTGYHHHRHAKSDPLPPFFLLMGFAIFCCVTQHVTFHPFTANLSLPPFRTQPMVRLGIHFPSYHTARNTACQRHFGEFSEYIAAIAKGERPAFQGTTYIVTYVARLEVVQQAPISMVRLSWRYTPPWCFTIISIMRKGRLCQEQQREKLKI